MRPQLPAPREDSSETELVALSASGVLDELDLLIADLRRVGLGDRADRVEVARAIVWLACSSVLTRAEAWRSDECTAEMEVRHVPR